jgi:hypothetical protein
MEQNEGGWPIQDEIGVRKFTGKWTKLGSDSDSPKKRGPDLIPEKGIGV